MWAFKRKIIVYIVFFIIIALIAIYYINKFTNKPPTCFDGLQNGKEEGVDCGGDCQYVCLNKVVPINGLWAKSFDVGNGFSNTVAYIENPNYDYEVKASYKIKNIDEEGVVLNDVTRDIVLKPGEKKMIFIPHIKTGNIKIKRTLVSTGAVVQAEKKERFKQKITVASKILKTDGNQTQLQVGLRNLDIKDVKNVEVVATLSTKKGVVFEVGKTFVERIKKKEEVKVNFTWQKIIDDKDVIIEVYPRIEEE
ncbi:hypothetical protein CSB11_00135 [Candidatus Campbellbacteria bacterium]|nr:MAG: hypothetical protein CSB11_00135 [Candidatus Campbellbacteria bacterium]